MENPIFSHQFQWIDLDPAIAGGFIVAVPPDLIRRWGRRVIARKPSDEETWSLGGC